MRIALPLVAFAAIATALPAFAEEEAPQLYEQVYLTKDQALKIALPAGDPVTTRTYAPRAEERKRIERRLGRKIEDDSFTVYQSASGGKPSGYAMILDEQGKYYPMTFVVGIKPDGSVRDVAVMVYRERRGDAVKRRRFLNQFLGKTSDDALMVNRDVVHLTGATVSSWSIAAGVKKAVVIIDELKASR
ncbi:FMN-binding protein [bacterium]|nr:FMN-binding protein [bacterium]